MRESDDRDCRESDDRELVERARSGDEEAFSELVGRHRNRALGWARSLAGDRHMAEDIVQEALLKSFLHLGTLVDVGRFLPWFSRIVRNQALKKLQPGHSFRKEVPFSGLVPEGNVDWSKLESILHHMTKTVAVASKDGADGDPAERFARMEIYDTLSELMNILSKREHAIFEAHFFQQLSPLEIARLFETSRASVYMSLHRSKQKIAAGRLRLSSQQTAVTGESEGKPTKRVILKKPKIKGSKFHLYNVSIRNCIYYLMPYVNRGDLSYAEVMGLIGHAFHINIEASKIDVSGSFMYDADSLLQNGLLNLGFHSHYVDHFGFERLPEGSRKNAIFNYHLDMIRGSVDRGVPAMVAGFADEFVLVYGYDDGKQLFYGMSTKSDDSYLYSQLWDRHLYAMVIEEPCELNEIAVLYRLLDMTIRHARGEEVTFVGFVNGLAAYDKWAEVFAERNVDELGNASTIKHVLESRQYAVTFLQLITDKWPSNAPWELEVARCLREANNAYEDVVDILQRLSRVFPFPSGGQPNDPDEANKAIEWLCAAKNAEERGIAAFEQVLSLLSENVPRNVPEFVQPSPFWVF